MPDPWEDLAESVVEAVKARAKEFLEKNADAAQFLSERARRLAKVAFDYARAKDDVERAKLKADLETVRQTIENEVATVAVKASKASREMFAKVLGAAMDVLVKALPVVIAAI